MSDPSEKPTDPSPAAASESPPSTDGSALSPDGDQSSFLLEVLRRERRAVQALAGFLEALPGSLHLDGVSEEKRGEALLAAASLDRALELGEQFMAASGG